MTFFWITLMGILGVWSRYAADLLLAKSKNGFPISTLVINVVGCFLIGIISSHPKISPPLRAGLIIGFCGSFTTFSSYLWQVNELSQKNLITGFGYFIVSAFLGMIALVLAQKLV